jgi:hypothetical protein
MGYKDTKKNNTNSYFEPPLSIFSLRPRRKKTGFPSLELGEVLSFRLFVVTNIILRN